MRSKISILTKALFLFFITIPTYALTDPGQFTFRIPGEPETLDWNRAHTPIETYLLMNLMEGLVSLDENLKVVPALAQTFTRSPDGKTYTFKLRPGVVWSDGVPLKAQDFVYSWKRLLSPRIAASYAYLLFDVEGAEDFYKGKVDDFSKVGIRALNDQTLEVKLSRAIAHWLYIPTFWVTFPLREDIVQKFGESWARPGNMVTVGPFTLVSHDLESKVVLRANPKYYGPHGNIQTAVAQIVRDDSTALNLYEAGKLDFLTDLSVTDLQRLERRPDLKKFPYLKTVYLGLVLAKHPMSNVHLRRALAMAIDKTKFAQILVGGQKPATTFIPPGIRGYSDKVGLPFDPAKAKAEYKASGADPFRPLEIELVSANWDRALLVTQYIQQEIKKNLGVDVTLRMFDNKTYRTQLDLKVYASFLGSWSADFPDADNFLSVYLSNSGNNRTGWKNNKFDPLVNAARSMQKEGDREKEYIKAEKILVEEDAVIIPLYYDNNVALVKSRVKNLVVSPVNYLYLKKVSLGP